MIKLSKWAKQHGVTYATAFSWFNKGVLPVKSIQLETGTILVEGFEDEEIKYTQEQVNEILRCAKDPEYFIKEYVKFKNVSGNICQLNNEQDEILNLFRKHKKIAIMKPRQRGVSTISLAYCLWYGLFHHGKKVVICSDKIDSSNYLLVSLVEMFKKLPEWMTRGSSVTRRNVTFSSGSIIASGIATGRGTTNDIDLLYIDEYAFHMPHNNPSNYVQVGQLFNTTENVIVVSSLRESRNYEYPDLFLDLWEDDKSGFYNHAVNV